MAKYRSGRINEEIKRYVSDIIQNKLKDPRVSGLISVTRVEVTKDLSYAKIYVSIFGNNENRDETLKALKSSAGFIRTELAHYIKIRHIPQLLIEIDDSLEYGMHIDNLLRKIGENDKNDNK